MRATLGGKPLDLEAGEYPRFTFSIDDIDDFGAVVGYKGTTLYLPPTNANTLAVGGSAMSEQTTDVNAFKVLEGTAVYFDGRAFVRTRSHGGSELSIVGGNGAWMSALRDKRLRDLNMGTVQDIDSTYIQSTWTDTTTHIVFPLVDYGGMELRGYGYNVPFGYLRPGIRLAPFLIKAFGDKGFSLVTDGAFADLFPKLVLPNVNETVPIAPYALDALDATYTAVVPQIVPSALNTYQQVNYTVATNDPSGAYVNNGRYQATVDLQAQITVNSDIRAIFSGLGFVHITVQLYDFTVNVGMAEKVYLLQPANPGVNDTHSFGTWDLVSGHEYGIRIKANHLGADSSTVVLDTGVFSVDATQILYQAGVDLNAAEQAPDMKVLDAFKWMCNLFCVQVKTNGSVVTLSHYDDFYQLPADGFVDLTERIDGDPVKVTDAIPSAYIFRMKEDDNDKLINAMREAGGEYAAGDARHLTGGEGEEKEITIGFAATAMAYLFEAVRAPCMRDEDADLLEAPDPNAGYYPDKYKWQPRILIMDGVVPGFWTFDSVGLEVVPNCFSYPGSQFGTVSAMFGDVEGTNGTVKRNWRTKLRRWTSPRLEVEAYWHDHEIMRFDPSFPVKVHDGKTAGFYYPQELEQHRFSLGQSTTTLLIPI